jgi:hypothetical protein
MESFIETQNITHFELLLKTETHPDKRKILLQLLAEEEAKRTAHVEAERAQNWRALSQTCRIRPPWGKTIEFNVKKPQVLRCAG